MPDVGQCPFGPAPHTRGRRHKHDYQIEGDAPRQCGCGSRHWEVVVFPMLPPTVHCARCGKTNRVATAYEKGRARGPRVRANAAAQAPY